MFIEGPRKPDTNSLCIAIAPLLNAFQDKKRLSLDSNLVVSDVFPEFVGQTFPFLNREAECLEYATALWTMYKAGKMPISEDIKKRLLSIPVIVGLSGLGKTTFARKAFERDLAIKCDSEEDEGFKNFVEVMRASLNIRIGELRVVTSECFERDLSVLFC